MVSRGVLGSRTLALTLASSLLGGCIAFVPMPGEPLSFGTTSRGVLHQGVALPDRGEGFVRSRPGESTRYGTPHLLEAIERAVGEVARRFPGSAPMRIGDVAAPGGGHHWRHGSHRTGRDVDVIFFLTDPAGRSRLGRGWLAMNRFGYGVEHEITEEGEGGPAGGLFFYDTPRNWWFVRTLLLDDEAAVQWIFVSAGVKAHLLRYAMAEEQDPRAIVRAAYVLQQPTNAQPHDDHFHVRVYCTPRELAGGCVNRGPIWPWLRDAIEKPDAIAGDALDDEALVRELMAPME
jgi:penicillin-insensitive murein endopeptidase